MFPVKQSTALTVPVFAHDVNGDAVTGLTDGSFTKRISKNGGAFGAMTVTIAELENGWYSIPLGTGHTDTLGILSVTFTNASAKQINIQLRVHARLPDDLCFPNTSGRGTDVTATGAVGIDWANVESQGTAVDLSATDIQLADTTTAVTNDVGITAGAVDDIWDEVLTGASHNDPTSAGRRLRELADAEIIRDNAFQAGSTTTSLVLDASASAVDDFFNHTIIRIIDGAGADQERIITDYDGTTKAATITPALVTSAPASGDTFEIVSGGVVHAETQGGGYENGQVWVDTNNGTAGTELYVNGTIDNPVDTIADAITIANALNLVQFQFLPSSSITLAADMSNFELLGKSWTLALGGQLINNTFISGATISGIGVSTTTACLIVDSTVGSVTLDQCTLERCGLSGTITSGTAGDYFLEQCFSAIAGTGTPSFDFGVALLTTNLNVRHYSGGIEIQNMGQAVTDNMSLEGDGQLVINANCAGGTVAIRGAFTVTDNAGGAVTLSDDARFTLSGTADATWDEVLTLAAHDVAESAGRRVRNLQEFEGYEDGAVWIDTVNGVGGTTDFENGTVGNPANSIGDANTLATSLGLTRFRVAPGSAITFVAAQSNQVFVGDAWTLALGGQSLVGTTIIGATVTGIASGTGTTQAFEKCHLMATSHIKGTHLIESAIEGTLTIVEAGDFFVDRCYSAIAGTATPTWDFGGALAASNVSFRNYSGGVEIQNMGAGAGSYNMSLEGRGQLIINANCSATSTVAIRGLFTVTDNAGGAVTLSDAARFAEDQSITTVTGNVDGSVASVGVGGIGSGVIAAAELNNIADGCLDRRLDLGTDSGGDTTTSRTWRQALRTARNRIAIVGGTMTVYEEDDVTSDFTAAVTTTAGDPITELDYT